MLFYFLFWSRFFDIKWTCLSDERVFLTQIRLRNQNKTCAYFDRADRKQWTTNFFLVWSLFITNLESLLLMN